MTFKEYERVIVKLAAIEQLEECKLTPEESRIIGLYLDPYLELDSSEETELEDTSSKLESDRKEETMEMLTSWDKKIV